MLNYQQQVLQNKRERAARGIFTVAALFSLGAVSWSLPYFFSATECPLSPARALENLFWVPNGRPLADTPSYGILPMIVTSLYVTALAVIFGVVIGLSTAVCLYRFCP